MAIGKKIRQKRALQGHGNRPKDNSSGFCASPCLRRVRPRSGKQKKAFALSYFAFPRSIAAFRIVPLKGNDMPFPFRRLTVQAIYTPFLPMLNHRVYMSRLAHQEIPHIAMNLIVVHIREKGVLLIIDMMGNLPYAETLFASLGQDSQYGISV